MKNLNLYLIILIIISLSISACKNTPENEEAIFKFYEGNKMDSLSKYIFKLGQPVKINDSTYASKHEFNFWQGGVKDGKFVSMYKLTGTLYENKRIIFLLPNEQFNPIKYFDFTKNLKERENINLTYKTLGYNGDSIIIQKPYTLVLEDKFYDTQKADTIYKFRFENIGVFQKDDDLVFLTGLKSGVTGIYNGKIHYNNDSINEEIFSYLGNIYKQRIDTTKVIFSKNIL